MTELNQIRYKRQKELWDYILVRFDKEDGAALRTLAQDRKMSVADVIRLFVTLGMENYE